MAPKSAGRSLIRVWDLPVRLFHWSLVVLLILLYGSAKGWFGLGMTHHFFLGQLTIAVLAFRLVWGFVGSDTARFANFLKGPTAVLAYGRDLLRNVSFKGVGHNPLGALMMMTLIGLVAISGITGLFTSDAIMTDGPLVANASTATVKNMSWVHRNIFNVTMVFAAVHICTALFYKYVKKDDIIHPMITGVEPRKPGQGRVELRFQSNTLALGLFTICLVVVFAGVKIIGS